MERKNRKTGDNISLKSSWTFKDKNVAKNFNEHVSKSVPLYDEGHEIIIDMLPNFFNERTKIIDIGCSTGTLVQKIRNNFLDYELDLVGIDISKEMINEAKRNSLDKKIKFNQQDFVKLKLDNESVDIFISYYTIQFIRPQIRMKYLRKIFDTLHWGGAFFWFEKTRGTDARFQDILTNAYFKYKERQGYSSENIYEKYMSLRGVLEPFSTNGNIDLLKEAGFSDFQSILKFGPFEGLLCIK